METNRSAGKRLGALRPARSRLAKGLLAAACCLACWWAASLLVGQPLLLPSPWQTLARFAKVIARGESWASAGMTLARVVAGYALGVVSGVLLAALSARFALADTLLAPLKSVVKATPVTSIILLAILWFRSGAVPVFIAFLMVLPLVWTNVLEGVRSVDARLLEMARVYRFSKWKTLSAVYAPSVKPPFLAACTTSLGFAWKSAVAAEILAQPKLSIGYRLYLSKLTIETEDLFAWTLLVILLSVLLEKLLVSLMRRFGHD